MCILIFGHHGLSHAEKRNIQTKEDVLHTVVRQSPVRAHPLAHRVRRRERANVGRRTATGRIAAAGGDWRGGGGRNVGVGAARAQRRVAHARGRARGRLLDPTALARGRAADERGVRGGGVQLVGFSVVTAKRTSKQMVRDANEGTCQRMGRARAAARKR